MKEVNTCVFSHWGHVNDSLFHFHSLHSASSYLEAEESDSIDDIVLPAGSRGRQNRQEVVDPKREEEQETKKVAPDVHGLIGQDKNAAEEKPRRT